MSRGQSKNSDDFIALTQKCHNSRTHGPLLAKEAIRYPENCEMTMAFHWNETRERYSMFGVPRKICQLVAGLEGVGFARIF
jgi:hypothetical protein